MQTLVRLHMAVHDVSRAEFEAVAQTLSRSAGHFRQRPASTNQVRIVGEFV